MTPIRILRRIIPAVALAVLVSGVPAMADFGPSRVIIGSSGARVTDLAGRGTRLALAWEGTTPGQQWSYLTWSGDAGETFHNDYLVNGPTDTRGGEVTICDSRAVLIGTKRGSGGDWLVRTRATRFSDGVGVGVDRTSSGVARDPDVACLGDDEIAYAWFRKTSSGWQLRVRTGRLTGNGPSAQTFDLGRATPSKGLSIAATGDRLYVAWFQGDALKLRRFKVASTSARTLTSLGTRTLSSQRYQTRPELDASGKRVILAYTHRADLKVRRSTNKAVSFGGATTIRNEPFPSEIGATALTVDIKGSDVVIGALEMGGVETLTGKGLVYRSTDAGRTYARIVTHNGGRVVNAFVTAGGTRVADLWDDSLAADPAGLVRFRREE